MSFAELGKMPLKHIPTEILIAMREGIRKELDVRGKRGDFEVAIKPKRSGRLNTLLYRSMSTEDRQVRPIYTRITTALRSVMPEDWSHLFPEGDTERRYYVYAHVNPRKKFIRSDGSFQLHLRGTPFYIGKGTGRRAWDLSRNEGHGLELKHLRNRGISDAEIVHIMKDNLTEREALEMESKLIYIFGTRFGASDTGFLVNLDLPPRPYA